MFKGANLNSSDFFPKLNTVFTKQSSLVKNLHF